MRDFDDNDFPLAYLITFRCYGSWLHGDDRGSMDRDHNAYGAPRIPANPALERSDASQREHASVSLNPRQRSVVEQAIRDVCEHRGYDLRALNVRSNHVHVVVSATSKPEPIMTAFKSYATRALRNAGLIARHAKAWSRHGSTVYLWKQDHVSRACAYVLLDQDKEFRREQSS
jgi:REP element-mobilizing transposase RayT